VSRSKRISAAIEAIDETAYRPVQYPGAITDLDTGVLIVRRVEDARYPDALFAVWRLTPS
jgi:hypothetical protein